MRRDVPAVIRRRLPHVVGHPRHLVRPHLLDDLDEPRVGVSLDVVLGAGELAAHQLGKFEHIGAPDMAFVGARMHGDAVGPGFKRDSQVLVPNKRLNADETPGSVTYRAYGAPPSCVRSLAADTLDRLRDVYR